MREQKITNNWIDVTCLECGKKFSCYPSEVKAGGGRYCSRSCAGKAGARAMRERYDFRGANNPNYKGDQALSKLDNKNRFRKRYPEKAKAHDTVRRALKLGKIKRGACEVCGATGDIHAHHDDYSKPLEVRWLCGKHHRIEHGATG